jgi:hypothetical protein
MRQPVAARGYPAWLRNGNLALAFLLELAALVAIALVGLLLPSGWWQLAAGALAVVAFVAVWARYAAPRAVHRLKGQRLLILKIVVFALAVLVLAGIGQPVCAAVMAVLVAVNLTLAWRLGQR